MPSYCGPSFQLGEGGVSPSPNVTNHLLKEEMKCYLSCIPQTPETPELQLLSSKGAGPSHEAVAPKQSCLLVPYIFWGSPNPSLAFPQHPLWPWATPSSRQSLSHRLSSDSVCTAACQEKDFSSRVGRALVRLLTPSDEIVISEQAQHCGHWTATSPSSRNPLETWWEMLSPLPCVSGRGENVSQPCPSPGIPSSQTLHKMPQ